MEDGMFARRHYRIIAQTIADLSLSDDEHDDCGLIQLGALRESIARQFADALATGNDNFNRDKFMAACLPQKKPRKAPRLPKGVTVVGLDDPAALHQAIAGAVGEPKAAKRAFDLHCPRCGKRSETRSEAMPRVSCGDCLMNDVEVVAMVAVERLEDESADS
jgi:hypothetical protein